LPEDPDVSNDGFIVAVVKLWSAIGCEVVQGNNGARPTVACK
jgi:hypothetical protein